MFKVVLLVRLNAELLLPPLPFWSNSSKNFDYPICRRGLSVPVKSVADRLSHNYDDLHTLFACVFLLFFFFLRGQSQCILGAVDVCYWR